MNRRITTTATAGTALVLALAGCSSGGQLEATPTVTVTVTAPAHGTNDNAAAAKPAPKPTPTPKPTPKATQAGHFKVGESGTMRRNTTNKPVLRVTVEKVETSTKTRSSYGKPAKWEYRFITVAYQNLLPESADPDNPDNQMPYNPLDWYLRDAAGNHYGSDSGHSFDAMDNIMDSGQLNPGEKARGTFAIDAPAKATELVYAPFDRTYAVWDLPAK